MSRHLIWLLSIKLVSWSCQLWYQCPLRVLTLLTKQDSGLLLDIFQCCCGKLNHGEEWYLAKSFDFSVLNWDHGLVNCGTNILCGCWLFWHNDIQVYCWMSFIIIAGDRIRQGEKTSCHFIWLLSIKLRLWSCQLWYQQPLWVLTHLTKRDLSLLLEIFQCCCGKQKHWGGEMSFHFIWSSPILFMNSLWEKFGRE